MVSEKLAGLLDMGVDCFKTDFGERIPVDGIEYFDHSDAKRCTITTLTCIIRLYMIYWKRSVAKAKQYFCTFRNSRRSEVPGALGR